MPKIGAGDPAGCPIAPPIDAPGTMPGIGDASGGWAGVTPGWFIGGDDGCDVSPAEGAARAHGETGNGESAPLVKGTPPGDAARPPPTPT
ncbi:hypothetical protein [Sorangium cellulosum]|uniref:Uncharacterized protein n=1 Tax=Sorangium cellulosum So0157-2 TaxID=1254432 RepID=S4Y1R0_SORCE|nr:hypothetical protein [Sorangium cellulosum]AGP38416.1 hypothetical protein SCE1572_30405 [Sorangium cellulosum So0157-2]